ncbi:Protein C27A12.9 [Aphelenchoides avenae]|nr:Protein C27A12.9 [Aphelenchus avenae]
MYCQVGRSACSDVLAHPHCWIRPQFNRSIWLIIDALRFDFIAPPAKGAPPNTFYHGQMRKVEAMLRDQPDRARLYRFIADAPTTTFQRIKGLTTGSIPAFIEAGENFGGSEILEDNLIDQLLRRGGNVTFMGDDTWLTLFPNRFHRAFDVPSFDVKDLDTVDNVVLEHVTHEAVRDDWKMLIAHCLGVDHCGHRYGPAHPEMTRKLRQMDDLIQNLTKLLPDDTIMFVMGDHGMTVTGDHGGDSLAETESALFVYAGRKIFDESPSSLPNYRSVRQIDLVPTLSLLLDLPIPLPNIGGLINELFPKDAVSYATKLNSMQMVRFAQEYAGYEPGLQDHIQWIIRDHEAGDENDLELNRRTIDQLQKVLTSALNKYDLALSRTALLSLMECLLYNLLLIGSRECNETSTLVVAVFRSALALLQASVYFGDSQDARTLLNFTLLASTAYHFVFVALQLFSTLRPTTALLSVGLVAFSSVSYLSNSFIVYESDVLRYLSQTAILWLLVGFLRTSRLPKRGSFYAFARPHLRSVAMWVVLCMALLRSGKAFEKCREEQVNCESSWLAASINSLPDDATKLQRLLLGTVGIVLLNWWFCTRISSDERLKPSSAATISRAISWPVVCAIVVHWLCELVPTRRFEQGSLRSAQAVHLAVLVHTVVVALFCSRQQLLPILLHTWSLLLAMLLGDGLTPSLAASVIVLSCLYEFMGESPIQYAVATLLVSSSAFFSLGHHATFPAIPWTAAFIGIPGNFPIKAVPASFVILHLFAGLFVASFLVTMRSSDHTTYAFIAGLALKVIGTCVAGIIHIRHLMLYKVFAPKFVFEAICMIFVLLLLMLLNILVKLKR